jgi:thiosulfate dehydrogenase [quinone] large subunit
MLNIKISNTGLASLFSRWTLGLFVGMIGFHKVFVLTPQVHAEKFFIEGFKESWVPDVLLNWLGYSIPFVELIIGLLLFIGYRVRETLVALGILLTIVAYGHLLQNVFYDPTSHFLPRFALMIFLLLIYSKEDEFTLENYLSNK